MTHKNTPSSIVDTTSSSSQIYKYNESNHRCLVLRCCKPAAAIVATSLCDAVHKCRPTTAAAATTIAETDRTDPSAATPTANSVGIGGPNATAAIFLQWTECGPRSCCCRLRSVFSSEFPGANELASGVGLDDERCRSGAAASISGRAEERHKYVTR